MSVEAMHRFPAGEEVERVSLTPAQKAQISARSRRGLSVVLMVQALSGLSVSLLLLVAAGWPAGLSALCGTLSYLVPNTLFVLRLVLSTFRPSGSGPITFLVGNTLKIAVAVGLLWGLSRLDADWVNWLAVVAGLIATLKGYWVAVLLTGGRITRHM